MDESILTAEKEVLVAVVKMAQKQKLKGDKGDWKEFLAIHDKNVAQRFNDPAKRSTDDLLSFLKTFSDEEVLKSFTKTVQTLLDRKSLAHPSNGSTEIEFPQQKLVTLTLQHPDYLSNYLFPTQNEDWVVTKVSKKSKAESDSMVAVDCEMVLNQDGSEEVVQVCVVDQNMEVILNDLVNPNKPVSDYRTDITGVSAKDLKEVTCSLADIQKKLKKLLRKGTILVGHSLHNDLRALKFIHPRIIDTSLIYSTPTRRKPSLNDLCKSTLGYAVRKVGHPHNCQDDARAAMKLVLAKLEIKCDDNKEVPASSKLLLHRIPRSVPVGELRRIFPNFTYELQPRIKAKRHQQKYTVTVVFKDPEEANEAFESIKITEEKDSFGYLQKPIEFELSTGMPVSLYVRKMVYDDKAVEEVASSKKRSAEVNDKDESKKSKTESTQCEVHVTEIERLRIELRQRDEEVASLQKILAALTRKQGL